MGHLARACVSSREVNKSQRAGSPSSSGEVPKLRQTIRVALPSFCLSLPFLSLSSSSHCLSTFLLQPTPLYLTSSSSTSSPAWTINLLSKACTPRTQCELTLLLSFFLFLSSRGLVKLISPFLSPYQPLVEIWSARLQGRPSQHPPH